MNTKRIEKADRLICDRFESLRYMLTFFPIHFNGVIIQDLSFATRVNGDGRRKDAFQFRLCHPSFAINFMIRFKRNKRDIVTVVPCTRFNQIIRLKKPLTCTVDDMETMQQILMKYWPKKFF
jgi:hypothetical protein